MSDRAFAAVRTSLYAAAVILLWWWVVVAALPLDARLPFALPAWLRIPGVLLILAGAVLLGCSIGAFVVVGRGTPAPFDAPREFVAVGPYSHVRNLMYVGAVTVILGVAFLIRSPAVAGVALLFFVLAHLFVVLYEERTLEARFGESYRRYRTSVGRWIPRRAPRSAAAAAEVS